MGPDARRARPAGPADDADPRSGDRRDRLGAPRAAARRRPAQVLPDAAALERGLPAREVLGRGGRPADPRRRAPRALARRGRAGPRARARRRASPTGSSTSRAAGCGSAGGCPDGYADRPVRTAALLDRYAPRLGELLPAAPRRRERDAEPRTGHARADAADSHGSRAWPARWPSRWPSGWCRRSSPAPRGGRATRPHAHRPCHLRRPARGRPRRGLGPAARRRTTCATRSRAASSSAPAFLTVLPGHVQLPDLRRQRQAEGLRRAAQGGLHEPPDRPRREPRRGPVDDPDAHVRRRRPGRRAGPAGPDLAVDRQLQRLGVRDARDPGLDGRRCASRPATTSRSGAAR